MNAVQGHLVGRISRSGQMVEKDGKKPFLACSVDIRREFNGKAYLQTVDVITYRDLDVLKSKLVAGALVYVVGEVGISRYTGKDSKEHANLKIMGTISVLQAPANAPPTSRTPDPEGDTPPF